MSESPLEPLFRFFNTSRLVRYLLLFAFGWALIQVLEYFKTIIVVFTFATILAFLLNYPVQWLKRYLPHALAVCIIFLLSLILATGLTITIGVTLLSQGQEVIRQAPDLLQTFLPIVDQIENILENANIPVEFEAIEGALREQILALVGVILAGIQGILTNLLDLIIIAVIAFFMLLDGGKVWQFVLGFFPASLRHNLSIALQNNFLGFFRGRLILSIFFGVSAYLVFLFLQTPYPLLLGFIGGLFDLIPGIGATIGIILIGVILLPQSIWLSLQIIVICILLQQIEENLLMPRIMQDSINLNPVVMFFALLVGATVAGLLGVFLAIPLAGVIVSLLNLEEIKS